MEYLLLDLNSIPEIVLAHYFSCDDFDSGWRKLPGIEIMVADKGDWLIETSGIKYVQKPGELFILPLPASHRVKTQGLIGAKSAHYALHFLFGGSCETLTEEEFKNRLNPLSGRKGDLTDIYQKRIILPFVFAKNENNLLIPLFKEIFLEWSGQEPHSKYASSVALQKLLVNISRMCIKNADREIKNPGRYSRDAVNRAVAFINDKFEKIESIQDIADHLNLNSSYLGSIFKSFMGISLVNYINALRVEKAKLLLSKTDLSFGEIGERVGISNPYYFSSVFKRYAGVTMSEYSKILPRQGARI